MLFAPSFRGKKIRDTGKMGGLFPVRKHICKFHFEMLQNQFIKLKWYIIAADAHKYTNIHS